MSLDEIYESEHMVNYGGLFIQDEQAKPVTKYKLNKGYILPGTITGTIWYDESSNIVATFTSNSEGELIFTTEYLDVSGIANFKTGEIELTGMTPIFRITVSYETLEKYK